MKFLTLFFLFIGTTILAQDNWQVLETDDYSIRYPQDWSSSDLMTQPSMKFLLLSEEESQKDDNFRENVNLTIEALGSNVMSIEDYTKISIDQVKAQIPSAKILSNSTTKIKNKPATEILWSADFGNGYKLKFKQIFAIKNGIAYIITYSSTEAEFEKYYETANGVLTSFNFKN